MNKLENSTEAGLGDKPKDRAEHHADGTLECRGFEMPNGACSLGLTGEYEFVRARAGVLLEMGTVQCNTSIPALETWGRTSTPC